MGNALTCTNHPERLASARCPSCARSICSECAIKIEGVNVCTSCLQKRAQRDQTGDGPAAGGAVMAAAGAVVGFAGLTTVLFLYGLLLSSVQ